MKRKNFLVVILSVVLVLTLASPLAHAKRKSYWARGMGIGAGAGGVAGFTAGTIMSKVSSCDNADEKEDCEALEALGTAVLTVGGIIVGGIVGTIIGAGIEKKPKVSISPTIINSKDGNLVGGGIGITGNF